MRAARNARGLAQVTEGRRWQGDGLQITAAGPQRSNSPQLGRQRGKMSLSAIIAGFTAAVIGCGGALAVVFAASTATHATAEETASWIAALCLAIALSTGVLSWRYRMPIMAAWSTPGAALIAATPGLTLPTAVGAFCVAAALIMLTALIGPLSRLVERLPLPIASAMLAGVLLKIVIGPFESLASAPVLILPVIIVFLVLRVVAPMLAVIAILIGGIAWAGGLGLLSAWPPLTFTTFLWIQPAFEPGIALGLGVPLYLVTMAS
jgi:benzoate membrane transport protein